MQSKYKVESNMISRKWFQLIKSLQIKKYRQIHQSFLVEGAKSVVELLLSGFETEMIFAAESFYENNKQYINCGFEIASEDELAKAGTLESNNACLAIVKMKKNILLQINKNEFALLLDEIKDPGNLGTIIRIADWYGINKIICSENSVDFYNPKVISASMGSFTRVQMYYCNLEDYLEQTKGTVYGALLEGKNIHEVNFENSGLILLGNESKGINENLKKYISQSISIPRFGGAESLNVSIAAAVVCDNLRRRK